MEQDSVFKRKISPYERLYIAGQNLLPPFVIQVFVEGDGEINIRDLERAVAQASQACPGARLVTQGKIWKDSGVSPPVREIDGQNFDGYSFDHLPILRQSLDPKEGPTCEVILLKRTSPTLIFRAFHGVMDGRGTLDWAKAVFQALRAETLRNARSPQTEVELLQTLRSEKHRRKLNFRSPFPFQSESSTDRSFFWKRRILPGNHPALVAKLASVISAWTQNPQIEVMVPVDLRHHDLHLQSTANLSLPIFMTIQRGEPWEVVHERLLSQLAQKRELALDGSEWALSGLPLFAIENFVRGAIQMQSRRRKYMASSLLSHLGRIDLKSFSSPHYSARTVYSLPVHTGFVPLSLVATECPNHVELTLSCSVGDRLEEEAEQLFDRITGGQIAGGRIAGANSVSGAKPVLETLIELFEERVRHSPQAVALVYKDGNNSMSYQELDCRASNVARFLQKRGVGPGSIVGLVAERTEGAVAALFGILKAGAAYLPLDPQYPDERIQWMLTDSRAKLCLASEKDVSRITGVFSGEVITWDQFPEENSSPPIQLTAKPHDLVYVIYTSGSTGRPKGVQIENRSLVNYVQWGIGAYQINASTRFALFTSLSFDLSASSLFLPLIAGGSVELYPEELNHWVLEKIVNSRRINALKLTPTHLELLGHLTLIPIGFRTLIVGGEQLKSTVAARAQEMFGPECRIFNEYGPTEATIGCMIHLYDDSLDRNSVAVPIGVPAHNTEIFLMDLQRQPVKRGEIGEIYIAGEGLARGYLHREDLNREKFVQLQGERRAYKTGDLARELSGGSLEFLGRKDEQLKIRGHRIEPGEIEVVLQEHPLVERAAVVGRTLRQGRDSVLCAYVVLKTPGVSELRNYLEKRLPSYLVPSFLIQVEAIPTTVNGKVDTQALPHPIANSATPPPEALPENWPETFDGPQEIRTQPDKLESAVSRIWAKVLNSDIHPSGMTPDSNFYNLGGDSLKMIEMLSTISRSLIQKDNEEQFMKNVLPLIKNPTLENICRSVRSCSGRHSL